jgi:hypothetical protein
LAVLIAPSRSTPRQRTPLDSSFRPGQPPFQERHSLIDKTTGTDCWGIVDDAHVESPFRLDDWHPLPPEKGVIN